MDTINRKTYVNNEKFKFIQKQKGLQRYIGAYRDVTCSLLMFFIIYNSFAELQKAKLCTSFNIYGTPSPLSFLPFK